MAAVISEVGLMNLLSLVTGAGWDFECRGFRNDITPDTGTVLGDFVEADHSGYTRIPLSDLPDPEISPGGKARIQLGDVSFVHNGGPVANDVYGYYVVAVKDGNTKYLWGDRFEDAPRVMSSLDDEIPITLVLTDTQEV